MIMIIVFEQKLVVKRIQHTYFEGVFEFYSNRLLSFNSSTVVDFSEKWKNEQKKNKTDENNMSS